MHVLDFGQGRVGRLNEFVKSSYVRLLMQRVKKFVIGEQCHTST